MNTKLKEYQKEYKKTLRGLNFGAVQFKELEEGVFRFILGKTSLKRDKITTNAFIDGKTLRVCPLETDARPDVFEVIHVLEYWQTIARFHELDSIQLGGEIPHSVFKNYVNYNLTESWGGMTMNDFTPLIEAMGLIKISDFSWKAEIGQMKSYYGTASRILEEMKKLKEVHPLMNFKFCPPTAKNGFLDVAFNWEGEDSRLCLLFENEEFHLHYHETFYKSKGCKETFNFTHETFSPSVEKLMLTISEKRRLLNLMKPPTTNLKKLLYKLVLFNYGEAFDEACSDAMEFFLQMNYSYQEVEQEATRIYNSSHVTEDVCLYPENEKERFVRFFERYYLILETKYDEDRKGSVFSPILVTGEQEVINYYQKRTEEKFKKLFAEKGFVIT